MIQVRKNSIRGKISYFIPVFLLSFVGFFLVWIMRKSVFLFVIFCALSFAGYAGDVVTSDAKRLPDVSRAFINRYFPAVQISHIKIEKDFLRVGKYEVLLTDRTELEFDGNGDWIEVECDRISVPSALIPDYVIAYLEKQFPNVIVVKLERKQKKKELEVELDNNLSLTFNAKGQLIDIDD